MNYDPELEALLSQPWSNNACRGYVIYAMENCGFSPQEVLELKERFIRLWNALNSLPEIQGRRIDAHIILGKSIKEIAEAEGVHEESVRQSIKRGLERMKKTF